MNLKSGFYFSYTLDLTNSIQSSFDLMKNKENVDPFYPASLNYDDKYVWNTYILQPFLQVCNIYEFVIPMIYGCIIQRSIAIENHEIVIGLISRRNRLHYGPRYLKRGLNSEGYCANEVVTEQFIYEKDQYNQYHYQISSFQLVNSLLFRVIIIILYVLV